MSDKIDLKTKAITRDKEGRYIILNGVARQEDITLVKIYAPNIGALKHVKKILEDIKKDIDSNTVVAGDFNTLLSTMDRSSKQNIIRILQHSMTLKIKGLNW